MHLLRLCILSLELPFFFFFGGGHIDTILKFGVLNKIFFSYVVGVTTVDLSPQREKGRQVKGFVRTPPWRAKNSV